MFHRVFVQAIIVYFCWNIFSTPTFAEIQQSSQSQAPTNVVRDPFKRARDTLPQVRQDPQLVQQQTPALTEPESNQQSTNLNGFTYQAGITIDAFTITAGGILEPKPSDREQDSEGIIGAIDLIAELDTGSSKLWEGGTFFFSSTLTFGNAPAVGDLNGISDKYAGKDSFRIIEAWYEHRFSYSHSSFLIGLQDFSNEFYLTAYSKPFLNNGFRVAQVPLPDK